MPPRSRPPLALVPAPPPAPADLDDLRLLTIPAVADRLGCTTRTVYTLIKAGDLPTVAFRGRHRVRPADLRAYLDHL